MLTESDILTAYQGLLPSPLSDLLFANACLILALATDLQSYVTKFCSLFAGSSVGCHGPVVVVSVVGFRLSLAR